ncbi:MAG: GtrA family protein [Patescibacteria group bacterium]|nr:GtrA family protein [Patescibacteria group bacterium]MDE2172822.1 GtrA family protein [Patescibacteria group bacterium]
MTTRDALRYRVVRYVISGASAAGFNIALTWLLERLGVYYIVVATVAYGASLVVSFIMQKYFTFGARDASHVQIEFGSYMFLSLVNIGVNDLIVFAEIRLLRFGYLVMAQAIASVLVAIYSFFIYRLIFRAGSGAETDAVHYESPLSLQ